MGARPLRITLLVMDSVGIGALPDAASYGDAGSNTVAHVARVTPLAVPTLRSCGLGRLVEIGGLPAPPPRGAFGRMAEASAGKDSITGHWEIAGVVLDRPFRTFPHGFPRDVIARFEAEIGRPSIGNIAASGTAILEALGPEHLRTGRPIVYTSADSVFQIAAHETLVPIDVLYRWCEIAYRLVAQPLGVARIIARPFTGEPGHFVRTANRRDVSLPPTAPTLLDALAGAGHPVVAVGKISDLFAGRGITRTAHATSDAHVMDLVDAILDEVEAGFIFANLVDFDTEFGHRNNPIGYAANLERFDTRLGRLLERIGPADLVFVTADHGNDPTTPSTDHSREYVPLFALGASVRPGVDLGTRRTFADLGQTIAELFGVRSLGHGESFARELLQ